MEIKAIETVYKGYRFRSRLEARWAVFFDALGIEWVYEPEGFELPDGSRYLPDFFVYIDKSRGLREGSGYWIEIKGQEPRADEIKKLSQLCQLTDHTGYIFSGLPSEKTWICCHRLGSIHEHGQDDEEVPWMRKFLFEMAIPWNRCANYNHSVSKSVIAARSARFEHGERGLYGRHH
jgi:hypothetical protein